MTRLLKLFAVILLGCTAESLEAASCALNGVGTVTCWYVRSAAGGSADGSTWANAYTTLSAALAAKSAGDFFMVADDHAETQASAMSLTAPGTASNPNQIWCTADHVSEPPTTKATSCTISTTGASTISFFGFTSAYGLTITAGNSTNNASINFVATTPWAWKLDASALRLGGNSTSSRFNLGLATGSTTDDQYLELINTTFQFANASQNIVLGEIRLLWRDTASAITGATLPTTLFKTAADIGGRVEIAGVDLSAVSGNLVDASIASTGPMDIYFRNVKTHASATPMTGAITGPGGGQVFFENYGSGSTNYKMAHYRYQGSTVEETTNVKTSGASDGTTALAWKMVSLTTGPSLQYALASPPIVLWNESTGSGMTATVEILHNSATNLKNSDAWLRCEYLTSSSFPTSSFASNRIADVFTSAADLAAGVGTGSWTTTGLGNANSQKLVTPSFTPNRKGPVSCQVMVAKANYTVYVNPQVTLQ